MPPGEYCDCCGEFYTEVYRVPEEVWEQLQKIHQCETMCLSCCKSIALRLGLGLYWEAAVGKFPTEARG